MKPYSSFRFTTNRPAKDYSPAPTALVRVYSDKVEKDNCIIAMKTLSSHPAVPNMNKDL